MVRHPRRKVLTRRGGVSHHTGSYEKRLAERRATDMSRLYGEPHRVLQEAFGTRNLADRVEQLACKTEFDEETKDFIEDRDMFFLATVDHQGRPTGSYKGGDPGFVKVVDRTPLLFPSYHGNGTFLSMANIAQSQHVGMLFIS